MTSLAVSRAPGLGGFRAPSRNHPVSGTKRSLVFFEGVFLCGEWLGRVGKGGRRLPPPPPHVGISLSGEVASGLRIWFHE